MNTMKLLTVVLILSACRSPFSDKSDDGEPDINDTHDTAEVGDEDEDLDRDGYTTEDGDCDDNDAEIHPEASELCDGIDNDCDSRVDDDDTDVEGMSTWYADSDEDGFGAESYTVDACEAPSGYTDVAGDCDDSDPAYNPGAPEDDCTDPNDYNCDGVAPYEDGDGDGFAGCEECDDGNAEIHPEAVEVCDGEDNDCDGTVDNDDAIDASTWYADADGDGYGDPSYTEVACDQPEDYTDNAEDCDDTDIHINPSEEEVCDDVDNDCDGTVDGDDAADRSTWYADADGDSYGNSAYTSEDCDQPSGYVIDDGDCDDGNAEIHPEATEVCDGEDNDCDGTADNDDAVDADTWHLDADGDGFGDADDWTTACDPPSAYVDNGDDCDDGDSAVHPDATEICDEIDNDCDGTTDNDDAVDAVDWYADADGDGYGNASITTTACDQPSSYTDNGDDCDDADADIHPAAEEICDELDNDCSGTADDDATDATTWYADSDGDGFGDSTTTTSSCDEPTGYIDEDTDCDDSDSSINPDAEEICADDEDNDCDGSIDELCPEEHCGYISSDETWIDNGVGHIITCPVYVAGSSSPVLTIEDGADVYFMAGTYMYVGYPYAGDMVIEGTSSGVTFTSYESSPEPGDYYGLYVYNQASSATEITGLTMEYGGTSYGNLYIYDADITVTDSTFQHSGTEGIFVYSAEPTITDTSILDNEGVGLYCYTTICLDETVDSFSGNTLSGNSSYPIRLYAPHVAALDSSSSFSGNDDDAIQVMGGTIVEDSTWHAHDVPYFVDTGFYVQHTTSQPVLTLEDGVEIEVDTDQWIYVGTSAYGNLIVEGSTTGVLMTSAESSPEAGDWYGLYLGYYADSTTELEGLTVEYAGGNSSYPAGVFLYYTQADSPLISQSTFRDNAGHGLYAYYYTYPIITDSVFEDNEAYGAYFSTAGLGDAFEDNLLTGNGSYSMSILPGSLGYLDASTSYSGNGSDFVQVSGGVISADTTISKLDVPYEVTTDLYVYGVASPIATIEDGVELYFAKNAGLLVGTSSYGELVVEGDWDRGDGVLFSAESGSSAGSWDGIYLGYYSTDTSELSGFTLEYAGGNSSAAAGLFMYYAEPTLTDCMIADNQYYGIYDYAGSELSMSDCEIRGSVAVGSTDGNGVDITTIAAWSDNIITDNDNYPVVIPGDEMVELDDGSTYAGNGSDYVKVDSYYAVTSGTWAALDVPFLVDNAWGYLNVYGSAAVPVEITAEDTEIYFAEDHLLYLGWSSYADIYADGVTFSSAESSPAAGDWKGMILGYYTQDSVITDSTVSYGGSNTSYPGNISCYYCTAEISDSSIGYSQYYGIYAVGSYSLTVSGNTYPSNGSGDTYPTSL